MSKEYEVRQILYTHPGTSSYHDGAIWIPMRRMDAPSTGIWLMPGQRLAVVQEAPAASPPVRLCCGQSHAGPVCPDGLVMCTLCFNRVTKDCLHKLPNGEVEDVCQECADAETLLMYSKAKASPWKQVCIDIGHALGLQHAEQFEDPELAKTLLLRHISLNTEAGKSEEI